MREGPAAESPVRHPPATVDQGIQALRGLAILLLVATHATAWVPELQGGRWEPIHAALALVRMPLFAAISGWVYALGEPGPGDGLRFVRKRARRLLLPVLAFGLLVIFVQTAPLRFTWPSSFAAAARELIQPRPQFWFVESLFVISLLVLALGAAGWLATARRWAIATALALALPLVVPTIPAWPWRRNEWAGGTVLLLGYVLLGYGAKRYADRRLRPASITVALAVLALGVVAQQLAWRGELALSLDRGGVLSLVVGVPAVLLLLHFRESIPGLAWLGPSTFAIFLYHIDGIEVGRRALAVAGAAPGPGSTYLLLVASGIALPMLAQNLLLRWRLTRRLFLGLR